MVDDVGEAIATVAGMIVAGYILIQLGQQLDSPAPVNMELWGIVFVVLGALATIALVYALIESVLP